MKIYVSTIAILLAVFILSCSHETLSETDKQLHQLIGDKSKFILPDETDYDAIPQSPVNPLTKKK